MVNYLVKYNIEKDSLKETNTEIIKGYSLMIKSHQRFKSEKHNMFFEKLVILL